MYAGRLGEDADDVVVDAIARIYGREQSLEHVPRILLSQVREDHGVKICQNGDLQMRLLCERTQDLLNGNASAEWTRNNAKISIFDRFTPQLYRIPPVRPLSFNTRRQYSASPGITSNSVPW